MSIIAITTSGLPVSISHASGASISQSGVPGGGLNLPSHGYNWPTLFRAHWSIKWGSFGIIQKL